MRKLAGKEYCTGCSACAAACPGGCIRMEPDENGFLHPYVEEERCMDCGLCVRICPVLGQRGPASGNMEVWAAISRDAEIRRESSSGGIVSELARWTLNRGGVVFGAAYTETFAVAHREAEDIQTLARLRGAKYAQSLLGDTFRQVKSHLEGGRQVLFCGTPCQVAGLKAYLGKDYGTLITVDFVCHSVPSPGAWQAYVRHRAREDNGGILPSAINLRDKETGWSRYSYSNRFVYKDGHVHSVRSPDSLYMKLFTGGYISRESCANCSFKDGAGAADVTIGDFWGIWNLAPEMDDNKGTSLVLTRTPRGAELLGNISDHLILKQMPLNAAAVENPALVRSASLNQNREKALKLIREENFRELEQLLREDLSGSQNEKTGPLRRLLRKLGF